MAKDELNVDNIIKEAQKLLIENKTEWVERYEGYAKATLSHIASIAKNRRKFHEYPPLRFYISTTNVKNARNMLLVDVRYRGQSVATLKATQTGVVISTKRQNVNNKKHFNCNIELSDVSWRGPEAQKFREYFKTAENTRNNKGKKNEEHNVESLLLSEFSKRSSKDKPIRGIQPVKICGMRFGMPTPISASDHKNPLRYAKQYGGGIDFFARTGGGSHSTYLTIIEVKDENKSTEPPKDALKQAIQYAVFIRELLRSDCGADWYQIFGFSGKRPQSLMIRVACAMPDDILDESFANKTYPIGNDVIECHYIYFKYDGKQLSNFQTSLLKG